jgi:FLVCR family feline leukemia virus subgroup C receptor-related protein
VLAITVAVAAQAIGAGFGFVLPTIWVDDNDTNMEFKIQVRSSLIAQAIAGGISLLLVLFLFKEKPPTPPSHAAEQRVEKPDFLMSIKKLFKNRDIIILMVVFAQVHGSFNALGTILGQLATGCGYTVNEAGLFGGLFIGGGIFGSVVFGIWVEKTRSYKKAMIIISFLSTIFTLG